MRALFAFVQFLGRVRREVVDESPRSNDSGASEVRQAACKLSLRAQQSSALSTRAQRRVRRLLPVCNYETLNGKQIKGADEVQRTEELQLAFACFRVAQNSR